MTVKSCEKLEKSMVALTIEVGAEAFETAVNKAYLKMRNKLNIPGFRPGKAPRKMIEAMYGAHVFYDDGLEEIFPEIYDFAVLKQDRNSPLAVELQIAIIYAVVNNLLREIPVDRIPAFEKELFEYLVATKDELLAGIRETGVMTDEATAEMKEAIVFCKEKFLNR